MDFDHPDHEPPRPVTPRAWVELSCFAREDWVKIFVPDEPVILVVEPRNHRPWMATHIGPGAGAGSFMIQPWRSPIYVRWTFVWKLQDWQCQGCQRVLSRQDSFDTNLDPHAPFPLDASRAALPLPAQLASSRIWTCAAPEVS